jgi:hypothetical protein
MGCMVHKAAAVLGVTSFLLKLLPNQQVLPAAAHVAVWGLTPVTVGGQLSSG